MNYSETVEVFNDLIQINFDRIAVYERAIANIDKGEFSAISADIMKGYIKDSQNNIAELSQHIKKMGGIPAIFVGIGGHFTFIWRDMKNASNFKKKETILESCITGDQTAVTAYRVALIDHTTIYLNDLISVLTKQLTIINCACTENKAHQRLQQIPN
jgi:uncharacterized protein (TIGR02284 family)